MPTAEQQPNEKQHAKWLTGENKNIKKKFKNHMYTYTILFYPEQATEFHNVHKHNPLKYTFVAYNRSHLDKECILHSSKGMKRRVLVKNTKIILRKLSIL